MKRPSSWIAFAIGLAFLLGARAVDAQNTAPAVCPITQVTTGGVAVQAMPPFVNGGVIWNPTGSAQGLFVNQTTTATTTEGAGNYQLVATASNPSQAWYVIPKSNKAVSVNSTDSAHPFGCLYW
jgi:hypothetical protein